MSMVTTLECFDSNRNFSTPTQSPWEQNACFNDPPRYNDMQD